MINLYINYYRPEEQKRYEEIAYCLEVNKNSKLVDKIYMYSDAMYPEMVHNKIEIVGTSRPTYSNFFDVMSRVSKDDDVNIIMNSDCFMDDASLTKISESLKVGEFWAITRHEIDAIDSGTMNVTKNDNSCANTSQDAWCIRGTLSKNVDANFYLGIMGCDNRIAYIMHSNGFAVKNPCNDVFVFHNHKSNVRTYSSFNFLLGKYAFISPSSINGNGELIIEDRWYRNQTFIQHFGLGDHFICNGAIRHIMANSRIENCFLFCDEMYLESVKFMYRDVAKLEIVPLKHSEITGNIQFDAKQKLRDYSHIVNFGALGLNSVNELRKFGSHFDSSFYGRVGVEFDRKWSDFKTIRDLDAENALYDKSGLRGRDYIFVHEDPTRGMMIREESIRGKCVVRPSLAFTKNIFDWCTIIENASEIHCIDSSFLNMIDIMGLGKCPKFVHAYSKQWSGADRWFFPELKHNWIEVNK